MSPTMHTAKQPGRSRVMIVDSELQFGLRLADCLATSGYHAVLVRDLASTLTQLREIQPAAILLSRDSAESSPSAPEGEALRTVNALCPQASVLALSQPRHPSSLMQSLSTGARPLGASSPRLEQPVEEVLSATLGIPCVRLQ